MCHGVALTFFDSIASKSWYKASDSMYEVHRTLGNVFEVAKSHKFDLLVGSAVIGTVLWYVNQKNRLDDMIREVLVLSTLVRSDASELDLIRLDREDELDECLNHRGVYFSSERMVGLIEKIDLYIVQLKRLDAQLNSFCSGRFKKLLWSKQAQSLLNQVEYLLKILDSAKSKAAVFNMLLLGRSMQEEQYAEIEKSVFSIQTITDMKKYIDAQSFTGYKKMEEHLNCLMFIYKEMQRNYRTIEYSDYISDALKLQMKNILNSSKNILMNLHMLDYMIFYMDFIKIYDNLDDQDKFLAAAQKFADGASYPLIYCHQQINQNFKDLSCSTLQCESTQNLLLSFFKDLYDRVISHPLYTKEQQHQEEMKLKRQQIYVLGKAARLAEKLAKGQANAMQEEAWDEQQQVCALFEYNEIMGESLENEKNKK